MVKVLEYSKMVTIMGRGDIYLAPMPFSSTAECIGKSVLIDGEERTISGIEFAATWRSPEQGKDMVGVLVRGHS